MKDKIKLLGYFALVGFGLLSIAELGERIGRSECANEIEKKIMAEKTIKFPSGQVLKFQQHAETEEES